MKVLDLYCGIGGASEGLHRAGFTVTGIDNDPKVAQWYPYKFVCADVLGISAAWMRQFDFIWASPPCQAHSLLKYRTGQQYENLIPETRQILIKSGRPYCIENVEAAKAELNDPIILCGTMFNLGTSCRDGQYRQLWRHRAFETNFNINALKCNHIGQPIGVFGDGGGGQQTRGYKAYADEGMSAMGIKHYAPRKYINQAIPPDFSYHIANEWKNE